MNTRLFNTYAQLLKKYGIDNVMVTTRGIERKIQGKPNEVLVSMKGLSSDSEPVILKTLTEDIKQENEIVDQLLNEDLNQEDETLEQKLPIPDQEQDIKREDEEDEMEQDQTAQYMDDNGRLQDIIKQYIFLNIRDVKKIKTKLKKEHDIIVSVDQIREIINILDNPQS